MFKPAFRAVALVALAFSFHAARAVDVLTYNNDNQRTGANTTETILNQSNVNSAQFGKLYTRNVDGIMYAQPLYVSSISIGGGIHNVVYVATMHNSVYAFDADQPALGAYWQKSMDNGAETSVPSTDVAGTDHNMYPEIGITSTPVIDKASNTIYLVSMTKLASPLTYTHRLHALDLSTGAEKFNGPVPISYPGGTVGSSTYPVFASMHQAQRPALLEANGSLYFSFASFSDVSTPYWGWVFRYNPTTLAQQYVFNTNPMNTTGKGAGIWESGCGASVDASGNVYLTTGNSDATDGSDAKTGGFDYSESALKFNSTGLTVADWYMPSGVAGIDSSDADFGGGGHLLLPDQPGSIPHVIICTGKTGEIYVVNRDNMTHFNANNDASIMQVLGVNGGACKGTPVYWNAPAGPHVFIEGENTNPMTSYSVAVGPNGYVQLTQDKQSANTYRLQHWAVSSNSNTAGTGIVWFWCLDNGGDVIHQTVPIPATLVALNAETLAELYNSDQAANGRDTLGGFAKYNTATVANGRVYVPVSADNTAGGQNQLAVFGLLADTTPPIILNVYAVNNNTAVTVVYSEPLNAASATNIANYAINQGVTVTNATLSTDGTTVTLTTSPMAASSYTLTVNNVKDVALNTIAANTTANYTYQVIPPTVSITSPTAGTTFTAPAVLQITATATAGAGTNIASVAFFVNGNPSGTVTAAPYSITLTNVTAGTYSLTAKATDNTGQATTSSAVSVTVSGNATGYGLNSRPTVGAYLNAEFPALSSGTFPATLSATGAFTLPFTAITPSSGLVPYVVNTPLWSDNAQKTRWMAIPNNGSPYTASQQIGFAPTGEWTFPTGSVFVKHFELPVDDTNPSVTQRLETRFIVRSSDGNVYGVTYKWRADYSDADLESAAGEDQVITIKTATGTRTQTWHYPSQAECLTCHTTLAGGVLGVKTRQLNGNFLYSSTGVTDNQLRTLNHIGMLNPVIQESAIPTYSKLVAVTDTTQTLDNRVRSYIDANCALCHRPGGTNAYFDARYDTPENSQGLIYGNCRNPMGIAGAKIVVPQNISRSLLYIRPNAIDATKMPPLAHNVVDANAVSTIQAWINGLALDAGASAISVQFEDPASQHNGLNIVTGAAGAYTDQSGVVASNWNTCVGVTGTNQVLKDNSSGTTTAVGSWQCPNTWSNGLTNDGGNGSLLHGYLDSDTINITSATINNIPYPIYNVYVYAQGDTAMRVGEYWAKSTVSPGGTDPGGKVIDMTNVTSSTLVDASATGQGNYVIFRGLTNPTCVISSQAFQYPGGSANGTRAPINGFQIVDASQTTPTLTGAVANSGPTAGGQVITVLGTNLLPGATFTIGGNAATNVTCLTDKGYSLTTPPGSGSAAIVYSGGNGTATLSAGFTYGASTPAIGDTISYHLNQSGTNGSATAMGSTETAGVIARTNWNNSVASVNLGTNTGLLDNLGTNSGVTLGFSSNDHNVNASITDAAGNARMMRSYLDANSNQPMFLTANNLPAAFQQFDMYVYLSRNGTVSIPASNARVSATTFNPSSGTSVSYPYTGGTNGYLQVTASNATGNYIVFPSVTPVNGSVRLEIEEPSSPYLLGVSGVQFVALVPTLTSVAANTATGSGGTTVTLTGTNFRSNALSITFGGTGATTFSMTDSSHYSVVTPPHSAGIVDIVMTDVNGRTATLSGQFTYTAGPAPTVASVTPNFGPTNGGTAVTITGTNFRTGATVQFGGQNGMTVVTIPASSVTVNSATQITCTTPAAAPANATGSTTVQVTNSDFTVGSLTSAFRYANPQPILVSLSSTSGPSSGNLTSNPVTLAASNHSFTSTGVQVVIGGVSVAATTVDDEHVTFVPPPHTQGAVDVSAINGDGPASANTLSASYSYLAPIIQLPAPNNGPVSGMTFVTISGGNFGPATTVSFGANAATQVTVLSTTSLTCLVPAGALGTVNVAISDAQTPSSVATLGDGYTYVAPTYRNPDNPAGTIPGTFFRYYNLAGPSVPSFAFQSPAIIGAKADANVLPLSTISYPITQSTNHCQQMTGYINVPYTGTWTFYAGSEDSTVLYIGNNQVLNNNNSAGVLHTRAGSIALNAGMHEFTLQFAHGTSSGFGSVLGWGSNDAPGTIPIDPLGTDHDGQPSAANVIPDSAFFYIPSTWNASGASNWSTAANWLTNTGLGAFVPAQSMTTANVQESLVLRFPGVGANAYTATNDSLNGTPIYVLELSSNVAGNTIGGNALLFGSGTPLITYSSTVGSLSGATILQLGSGATTVSAPVTVNSNLMLRGNGTGLVTLSGALSNMAGANLIKNDGSTYVLAGNGSGFTGVITVSAGMLGINSTVNAATALVASGAVLRGTGTLGGAVAVSGMIFPGDASSTLTNAPKGTLTVNSADFSVNGGTLRARVWLKDATHAEADNLTLATTGSAALKLDATSTLDLRVEVPTGVVVCNNLDVEIVQGGDANNNTYSAGFGNLTLSYGAGVTNMSVLYVNSSFVPNNNDTTNIVATQTANQAPSVALGANSFNRVFVRFNNAVTPIKVESFTAATQGAGVLLEWKLASEYQNAGFNLWQRDVERSSRSVQADGGTEQELRSTWKKINPTLIDGRITNPDAKTYRYYVWEEPGQYEYRLESVDIHAARDYFSPFAAASVDTISDLPDEVSADGMDAATASVQAEAMLARGAMLSQNMLERSGSSVLPAAKITRVDCNTDPAVLAALGFSAGVRAAAPVSSLSAHVLPRYLSVPVGTVSLPANTAAKVLYQNSGVLRVPQASLPAGFSVGHVAIRREGVPVVALAATATDLILYAPGYADDYTDKDAFFLSASSSATAAGVQSVASGLFDASVSALTTVSASAVTQYHDVYFDWTLRPYTYPPWFSSQYLTDGSTQSFTVNVPAATAAAGVLTLNVWSLTGTGDTVSPDHNLQAFVNGVPVGSTLWDGGGTAFALSFAIPAHTLAVGNNTVELVTPALAGVASQIVLVQSISVQYTKALNTGGAADIVTPAGQSQVYEVAGLATANLWAVDARFPTQAHLIPYQTQVQADGSYTARFTAAPGGTGEYLVVPAGSELAPFSVSERIVRPIAAGVRYLAVGPQQFSAATQPLLLLHGKEGITSVFVDQEAVFDYYGYGRYGPVPIQNAIRSLRPQYVLLVGRTVYDYRNYSGANVDPLCPTFLISTSFWAQATSDAEFGDLGHGYAEVSIGRFPVDTVAELQGAVKHTLEYQGLPESGWRGHLVADQPDPSAGNFPVEADGMAQAVSGVTWSKNYLAAPAAANQPGVTAALQNAANGDADLIVYVGHGNAVHLGAQVPYILDPASVQGWTGNVILLQSTCTANWIAQDVANYQSIAIAALTQPQGGIAASLATTTYCTSPPAVDFMEQLLQQAQTAPARWGGALLKSQQYAYWQSMNAPAATGQWYADLARTECLLGDPALNVFGKSQPAVGNRNSQR